MMSQMNVNLAPEVRQRIEAAIPAKAYVTPKKARKVLVIDACVANMSHNTIPHGNLMIELMAKKTGAFEAEFSNDFEKLKYPKIKEYDAIFLNNTVGELFPDPAVREGLSRFVREGGGLGALHGATYASRNWRELGEMLGAQDAPHRVEPGTLRVDDPGNPIMQAFDGKDLDHREEYYRFPHEGPTAVFSREKVRVLLTVEFPPGTRYSYERPDKDYPVSWVKSVGQGRTFNCSLGHVPETFMNPQIVGHLLGAIQFLAGDLEVETVPKPRRTVAAQ
jgi:type 1 glutamine amidotransferase